MKTSTARRPFIRKKSDWAREKSREYTRLAYELRREPVTSAREAGQREQAIRHLNSEASRFATLARRYEERGM